MRRGYTAAALLVRYVGVPRAHYAAAAGRPTPTPTHSFSSPSSPSSSSKALSRPRAGRPFAATTITQAAGLGRTFDETSAVILAAASSPEQQSTCCARQPLLTAKFLAEKTLSESDCCSVNAVDVLLSALTCQPSCSSSRLNLDSLRVLEGSKTWTLRPCLSPCAAASWSTSWAGVGSGAVLTSARVGPHSGRFLAASGDLRRFSLTASDWIAARKDKRRREEASRSRRRRYAKGSTAEAGQARAAEAATAVGAGSGQAQSQTQGAPLSWGETDWTSNMPQQLFQQTWGDPAVAADQQYKPNWWGAADMLGRGDLVVTRRVEWGSILLGFEQESKYEVLDPRTRQLVGIIVEKSNWIMRQLLGRRRHFTAAMLDHNGHPLFSVERPFFWISSRLYVSFGNERVGEVKGRWHLWRRNYDLYVRDQQFGEVQNPGFWWWTFKVTDYDGQTLALVDRNWRGLGFEAFTDAGQYVVRLGPPLKGDAMESVRSAPHAHPSAMTREQEERMGHSAEQVPYLEVVRPLSLEERAVTLAFAISLDCDFFSRHSQGGGGWLFALPILGGE